MKNTTDEDVFETMVALHTVADFTGLTARVLYPLYEAGILFDVSKGVLTAPEYERLEAYLEDWGGVRGR